MMGLRGTPSGRPPSGRQADDDRNMVGSYAHDALAELLNDPVGATFLRDFNFFVLVDLLIRLSIGTTIVSASSSIAE